MSQKVDTLGRLTRTPSGIDPTGFPLLDIGNVQRPPGEKPPWDSPEERGPYSQTEVTPAGWYERYLPTANLLLGSTLIEDALGFDAYTVLVDNWTTRWLYIDAVRRYVPSYSGGWIFILPSGTQVAKIQVQVPNSAIVLAGAVPNEFCWVAWCEKMLPPASGIRLTAGLT